MSEETAKIAPYTHLLEGRDPAEVMRATIPAVQAILARLSPEEISAKPAPKKWSLRELLCHLADCEVAWAWRLRQAYGEDTPTVQPFDQDPWARAYDGVLYTAEQAIQTWSALRAWNLALIETLTPEDRVRALLHPEIGRMQLWTLVEIAAGHDLHHLRGLQRYATT